MAQRLVVVGGGVIGSMHAWQGVSRGWEVVQLEREAVPRGASVRNFGLIWVSGREAGNELDLALRARQLWQEIAAACPGTGFRANGSLTVASNADEMKVLEAAASLPDAAARGLTLLDASGARRVNPVLSGQLCGALWCEADAAVEPREVPAALRLACAATGRYTWLPGREVVSVSDRSVTEASGARHHGDRVVLCTGAVHGGVLGEILAGAPVRRVRLQMLETEPFPAVLTTSVADGDSLRYYPAFAGPALDALPPQSEVAARWAAQLLLVQRRHGGLTIGDTHASDEPFAFDVDEAPSRHLLAVAASLLGVELPPVARRWAGVYSQVVPGSGAVYLRLPVADGVELVTGPGGRGMTLSPAIAEETFR